MNLTSKRILQFAMVCAGICALSASAVTQYIADSFENDGETPPYYAATNGIGIKYYKAQDNGAGVPINGAYTVAEGDASKIVNADANNQAYSASTRPMAGVVSNLVLNLETEGQTLTRPVTGAPYNFVTGNPVYVDTLIKFTPSEDNPVIKDLNVKAAVFVNSVSNLVVYHGVFASVPSTTDTGIAIDPTQWYRLTILLSQIEGLAFFKVYLDGEEISTASGYTAEGGRPGPWFKSASTDNTLNAVALQGTGMIDELVVADEVSFGGPAAILLTLSFDASKVSVTADSVPVANNGTVATGTEIVIDAADWYEIVSVLGADTGVYAGSPDPGALVNVSTGTVTAAAADTMTITVQPYSTSTDISTGLGGSLPADKVAAWAIANELDAGELTGDMLDDYLCNVAPGTNPGLTITSIVLDQDEGVATITVEASEGVDLGDINGTLVVYTADTVAGIADEATPEDEFQVTLAAGTSATIEVNMAGNNFIRAAIK